jgi:protocatechuate 3,4-dioxygenase beta subunit
MGMAIMGGVVALLLLAYLLPVPVAGAVFDAETSQPLADVVVRLPDGTQAVTDGAGQFSARAGRFADNAFELDNDSYQVWQGVPTFSPVPLVAASLPVSLQPTRLQGRVLDATTGQPVAGAVVSSGEQTATTDQSGAYTLWRIPRSGAPLQVEAEGFIIYHNNLGDWAPDGSLPTDLQVLADGVHGTLVDARTGEPIAGGVVALGGESINTAEDGFFYFAGPAVAGDVSATAPGYLPAEMVAAQIDEGTLVGDVALEMLMEPNVLRGKVADGRDGTPLAGVQVRAGDQTATTDGAGQFQLERLADQAVELSLDGYNDVSAPVDGVVNLTGGEPLAVAMLPRHLAGRVVNQLTQSPVAGAEVTANGEVFVTDADGLFRAWGAEAPLAITARASGFFDGEARFEDEGEITIALEPRVAVLSFSDGLTGAPLAGVTVAGQRSQGTSDAQGVALVEALAPGDVFTATIKGYATATGTYEESGQVALEMVPDTAAGRVVDATTGEPVQGAVVYVYDDETCQGEACRGRPPVVMADAAPDGTFTVVGMPARPQLMIKAPGYSLGFPETLGSGDCGAPYCLEASLQPFEARGFYVPFHYLYDRALIEQRLDLIAESDVLNAVVVDMKSDYGKIAWEPRNEVAREIGVYEPDAMSAQEFLEEARKRGIYTIARFVTFKDNALAEGKPEWALAKKTNPGVLWRDGEDLAWADPYRQEVRQYELDLAKELSELGFDEIQFDYFRFTGQTNHNQFTYSVESTAENRREAITSFSHELMRELKPFGIFTAIDVFGSIILNGHEPYIGQNLAEMAQGLDYLSPMIYPQVWWPGTFPGCDEPVLCPYKIIYDSTATVREIVPLPTRIRPWLQGYPNNYRTTGPAAGYNYAVPEMMIQRQAAEDAGAEGWLFWSGGGKFPDEIFGPLPSLAELEAQVKARQAGRG